MIAAGPAIDGRHVSGNFAGPRRRGGLAQKYHLTDEIRAVLLREYDSRNVRALAARFGLPAWVVSKWAGQLGVRRTKEPRWSEADLAYLRTNLSRVGWVGLAKHLGRTVVSVQLKARRLAICKSADGFTQRGLAQLLGVDDHKVARWIDWGWLSAGRRSTDRVPVQGGDIVRITEAAVRRFCRDHGEEIDLRRVDRQWFMALAFGEPREYA